MSLLDENQSSIASEISSQNSFGGGDDPDRPKNNDFGRFNPKN